MRVAVIVDIHGWALDHIAHAIKRFNSDPTIEIDILYQDELSRWRPEANRLTLSDYDVVYPLCEYQAAWARRTGISDYITTVHMGPFLTRTLPGELPPFEDYIAPIRDAVLGASRISAISPLLMALWSRDRLHMPRRLVVGVDPIVFYPSPAAPREDARLRVGWVGNPEKPCKRFELITEAVDGLKIEFDPIVWTPSLGKKLLTHPEMSDYFRSLDLYICMSDHEGLPTPGIEAAMCGVPLVSTNVGVVRELVVEGKTGWVVNQDPTAMRARLKWAMEHREAVAAAKVAMAAHARPILDWRTRAPEWVSFMAGDVVRPAEDDVQRRVVTREEAKPRDKKRPDIRQAGRGGKGRTITVREASERQGRL